MKTNRSPYLSELFNLMKETGLPEASARELINEKIKSRFTPCYVCGELFLGRKKYCSMKCELIYKKN